MRYEKKYHIPNLQHHLALQCVRLHPVGFRKIYPDRQVNNIYFDSPNLTTYHDNVAGVSHRKKYRIRWYADKPSNIQHPKLEVKIKENQLGRKEVQAVEAFDLNNLRDITQSVNQLTKTHAPLQPVLMNAYMRSYFGSPDGKFRITIDRALRYHSMLKTPNFHHYLLQDPAVILEIKYDETLDSEIDRITQFIPFRQTKSSKYVTGVTMMHYK